MTGSASPSSSASRPISRVTSSFSPTTKTGGTFAFHGPPSNDTARRPAFSVYLRDPDGHRVEIYTSDYSTGDPDHETFRWNVHDDRRRDFWGNAVIESWYEEASPVLDLDGRLQPVSESVLDESAVQVGADGLGIVGPS